MSDTPHKIPVNTDLRPAYFDKFHCLAQGCRLSCCKNWNITFSKKDYLALKRQELSPETSERMERALHRLRSKKEAAQYAEFRLDQGGACPLLAESGLCTLQLEAGGDALPFVCRHFPRKDIYAVSGSLEYSLSPACEAVLHQIWELPEGIDFLSDDLPKEKQKVANYSDAQPMLPYAQEIRSLCIDLLQDRRMPLPQRLLVLGVRLQELTKASAELPVWIAQTQAILTDPAVPELGKALTDVTDRSSKKMYIASNLNVLLRLMISEVNFRRIGPAILQALNCTAESGNVITFDLADYRKAEETFRETFAERAYFFENMAVTLFFHLTLPDLSSAEDLWKSYVSFCNLYSFYRFLAVLSAKTQCPVPPGCAFDAAPLTPGTKEAMFELLTLASRGLIHNSVRRATLRDEFFKNESATLAHMAILVSA